MMKLFKNEDAFTGLEAAIVLIAFVVVAAVFSYVVLGAGFFTTGEAQRVVHTGSQQASSSLEIIGNVYGHATVSSSSSSMVLTSIEFTVGNTAGGTAIDISQMLVTYTCEGTSDVIEYDDTTFSDGWAVMTKYNEIGTSNNLLEPGEQFVLKVKVLTPALNKQFSVNLQPAVGAVYPIKLTVPPNLDKVNILH